MKVTSYVPFAKIRNINSLRPKFKTPCVAARGDGKEFMDSKGQWVEDMDFADIGFLPDLYDRVKDLDFKNSIVFYFLKI